MACREELGHAQGQLPFAKFGVSYVLLHSGFVNVVLSEVDVFLLRVPSSDVQGVHPGWAFNMGFMMLRDRSGPFSSPVPREFQRSSSAALELQVAQLFKSFNITGCFQIPIQTGVFFEILQSLTATMRLASCNTFSSQDHAEAGFAKTGTAQFWHRLSFVEHEIAGHMACVRSWACPAVQEFEHHRIISR